MQPNISHDAANVKTCDYIVSVDWEVTVPRGEAKRISKKNGHYAPQRIRASLSDQPATITFVDESFDVDLRSLADTG